MEYISTRNKEKKFTFVDIFLKGLAPDGGLFVPKKIPKYNSQELIELRDFSYNNLASEIIFKVVAEFSNWNSLERYWKAVGSSNAVFTLLSVT